MQRSQTKSRTKSRRGFRPNRHNQDQQGIIIVLVAVFLLGVVGAMAALSIDVITLYTAHSEAQLAADAGALAGARVLANSGMTSDTTGLLTAGAEALALTVATQVTASSMVGGRYLMPTGKLCAAGEISVCFSNDTNVPATNPHVKVTTLRTDLPTFFARMWGRTQLTVSATATAEAFNPSSTSGITSTNPPVAPLCVKPWLLPNISPTPAGGPIFAAASGTISDATLLGWQSPVGGGGNRLRTDCAGGGGSCSAANTPTVWRYYPGTTDPATGDFPAPSNASVACCTGLGFNPYQLSIAGCVQTPIACNQTVQVDQTSDTTRDSETGSAVNGMTHTSAPGTGDSVETNPAPPQAGTAPFQFVAGTENPLVLSGALTAGLDVMVSDSLVTVPVIDTTTWPAAFPQVQIIGFVQLFLNPLGDPPAPANGRIHTRVINIVGCGNSAAGTGITPILGNGASPVAVRLITPP